MVGIMGARTGLWVVLHPKERLLAMGHRRHGAVVEVEMGHLNTGRQCLGINGKTMVLAGDFHLSSGAAWGRDDQNPA